MAQQNMEPDKIKANAPNWNELQFLSWTEFSQMAPSILQLEVTRLGKVADTIQDDTDFHNGIVRARFELKKFIECLKKADKDNLEDACLSHLRNAIMSASFQPDNLDKDTEDTCRYILERLNYVYHRIGMIY